MRSRSGPNAFRSEEIWAWRLFSSTIRSGHTRRWRTTRNRPNSIAASYSGSPAMAPGLYSRGSGLFRTNQAAAKTFEAPSRTVGPTSHLTIGRQHSKEPQRDEPSSRKSRSPAEHSGVSEIPRGRRRQDDGANDSGRSARGAGEYPVEDRGRPSEGGRHGTDNQ